MKRILMIVAIAFLATVTYAQPNPPADKKSLEKTTINTEKAIEEIPAPHVRQLYLDEPAKAVESIEYKDGTPLKGHLSEDGMILYIENYTKRSGINAKLKMTSGEDRDIKRSPCYIDELEES